MCVDVGVLSWGPHGQALLEVLSFGESVVCRGILTMEEEVAG